MGNATSKKKKDGGHEENSLASSAAEAAAKGARQAVREAVEKAQKDVALARGDQEIDPEAAEEILVAKVLPLSLAQAAAASGAKRGLGDMARDRQPAGQPAPDFTKLKDAASSGASWGVKAAGLMARQGDIDQEGAAAAAATGAWIMCCLHVRTSLAPAPDASKYSTLLGQLLGGSLPASVAVYHLVHGSSDLVQFFTFGGITLGVFVIVAGLIVGHFGNTPESVLYTKIAIIAVFVILLAFFTIVLCTLLSLKIQQAICATICCCFILLLVFGSIYLIRTS